MTKQDATEVRSEDENEEENYDEFDVLTDIHTDSRWEFKIVHCAPKSEKKMQFGRISEWYELIFFINLFLCSVKKNQNVHFSSANTHIHNSFLHYSYIFWGLWTVQIG